MQDDFERVANRIEIRLRESEILVASSQHSCSEGRINHMKNIDMLTGSLYRNILLFTIPIALSSMLQQLFNAADTAIIGFFDTSASLAAVGTNGEIIALIVSLSSGLSVGVNVLIARQIGRHEDHTMASIIRSTMLLGVVIGVIGLIIGQCISGPLLTLIKTPSDILDSAIIYLRVYFIGYPFLILYDFTAAICRARGNSRYPFWALTLSGIANVFFNLVFVVLLHLGVSGVAVATVISTMLSALLMICRLRKEIPVCSFSFCKQDLYFDYIWDILKIGIPSALQGAVFCFANIFVQASVNHFGSLAIAGSTIAMNFEYFAYYIITAFGQTATTFTSQNHAAGQNKRCRKILWICMIFSILINLAIIEPLIIFQSFFIRFFSSDTTVIQNARLRIMCILFFEPLCSLYEIPAGVLRGTGHSLYPAIATIVGTCCFRILWIYTVFSSHCPLNILYSAFPLSWILTIFFVLMGFVIIKPIKHQ